MIQYILWAVSFISLWITLVWLNVLVMEPKPKATLARLPHVTIALPCYNRELGLGKTIRSLMALHYPKNLLQFIIVDDCSTDRTLAEAKWIQKKHPEYDILVLEHPKNRGKAAAVNTALAEAKGELFACLDADTTVHPDALNLLVHHFASIDLGAVIGQVKVDGPQNLYERLQRVEYILSNFIRRLWSNMSTLFVAPGGALSVFNTEILRKVGGFAEAGLTEDLEIALRLKANGYDVQMEPRAITYTKVPQDWNALWRQRIRWYRGFVVNHAKYKKLFFDPSRGALGMFQLPLNVLSVGLMLLTVLLVSYGSLRNLYQALYRSITIKGYFLNHLLDLPTFKEFMLSQNVQVALPIVLGTVLGFYLIYLAHRQMEERLLVNIHHVWLYFVISPYVTTVHWISALMQEAFGTRRKW
jgi:cellulose synthase/poly-beta-1,6-N-acetylglucosamine synthase-like glycosyltransferase